MRRTLLSWLLVFSIFFSASILSLVTTTGCTTSPLNPVSVLLPDCTGIWTGQWFDTVFNVSGNIRLVVDQSAGMVSSNGTIDVSQLGLGMQSGTSSGNINGNTLQATIQSPALGSGTMTVNGRTITGSGTIGGF